MQQITSENQTIAAPFVFETDKNGFENEGIKVRRWTRDEYYKMAELGFFYGKRVELIEGEIIEMSPMNKPHATAVRVVLDALRKIFVEGYVIDSQLPMSFSKRSEPEPDVAVIKGGIRDFEKSHPKTAELIVEVSDSTLRFDRTKKAALYAQNKIQDYWILNLKNRCLEVYRQAKKDKKLGYIYTESRIFTETDKVSPLAAPDAKIKVADLLP
jgi:Uma2 family endonuclease